MLTLEKIRQRLKEIDDQSQDDERAHVWEKELWQDTLHHIAKHSVDHEVAEFAKEALKSLRINFARWFA